MTLEDAHGPVDFWLLLKPVHLRRFFPEEGVESYTDAMACAIRHMPLDQSRRNALVTHQFVTGAEQCESEEINSPDGDQLRRGNFSTISIESAVEGEPPITWIQPSGMNILIADRVLFTEFQSSSSRKVPLGGGVGIHRLMAPPGHTGCTTLMCHFIGS